MVQTGDAWSRDSVLRSVAQRLASGVKPSVLVPRKKLGRELVEFADVGLDPNRSKTVFAQRER
jgi:hypothetical protein